MKPFHLFPRVLFLLLLLFNASFSSELEKVSLQLQWKHQFEFAGFYAAIEKGYYREAGLEVTLKELEKQTDITEEIISGQSTYGIGSSKVILDRLKGRPVILLANYFKRSPYTLITQPDISLPSDLKGKKIMGEMNEVAGIGISQMLNLFNLSTQDVKIIPHEFSLDRFIRGEVSATTAFLTNEPYELRSKNIPFNILDPKNYGSDHYDVILFGSESDILEHPDRARRFIEASNQGWQYALDNPSEIIDLILKKYNTQKKSRGALEYEAKMTQTLTLPKVYPLGSIDPERIHTTEELMVQSGLAEIAENPSNFIFGSSIDSGVDGEEVGVDYQKKADEIAGFVSFPLYNLDTNGINALIERYLKNPFLKAIQVIDASVKRPFVSSYRNGSAITHRTFDGFPKDFQKPGLYFESPIMYEGEQLGKVILYADSALQLTQEENEYLQKNPIIQIGYSQLAPYTFSQRGRPNGFAIDFLKAISESTGLNFSFHFDTLANNLQKIKTNLLDIQCSLIVSPEREKYLHFLGNPIEVKLMMYTLEDNNDISTLESLAHKKIATYPGYALKELIQKKVPQAQLIEFENREEMFLGVAERKADVVIVEETMGRYTIAKESLKHLKEAGRINLFGSKTVHAHHFSTRKNAPLLISIMEKAIDTVPLSRKQELHRKWLAESPEMIRLTHEEKAFIAEHPRIVFGTDENWDPWVIPSSDGSLSGLDVDYVNYINQQTGLQIKIRTGQWSNMIQKAEKREIDGLSTSAVHPERQKSFLFSDIYSQAYQACFIRSESESFKNLSEMKGKKIAYISGNLFLEKLMAQHPDIIPIPVKNEKLGYQDLAAGKVDGYLGGLNSGMNKQIPAYSGVIKLGFLVIEHPTELVFSIRKDWPELVSIINKVLASMPKEKQDEIFFKWHKVHHPDSNRITLTSKERAFLAQHPTIQVHNETNWPPFNFSENGRPSGYSVDYMQLVASKVGVKLNYITGPTWDEFVDMIKEKEIDVILNMINTPERQKFITFTRPYVSLPDTIFIRRDSPRITSLEELKGKKVAIPKSFAIQEEIQEKHPDIQLLLKDDFLECLKAVSFGEADATIESLPVFSYLTQKHFITNVVPSGEIKRPEGPPQLHFGVRKDWPLLRDILQKGMDAVTEVEKLELSRKWFSQESQTSRSIPLTPQEEKFLRDHPLIRTSNLLSYIPFSFKEGNTPKGYCIDFANMVADKLGIKFNYVSGSFSEQLKMLKNKEIDLFPTIAYLKERESFVRYTQPYYAFHVGLAAKQENIPTLSPETLKYKTLSVIQDYYLQDIIQQHYPDIRLFPVSDINEGLEAVMSGKVDAHIGMLPVMNYHIRKNFLIGLNTKPILNDSRFKRNFGYMGVRHDWPIFRDILQKGIDAITEEEHQKLRSRWIGEEDNHANGLPLTQEERQFLSQKKEIKMCVLPSYMPYEGIDSKGQHVGVAEDMVRIMERRIGIPIRLHPTKTWEESLEAVKKRECDILPAAQNLPYRRKFLFFTEPYITSTTVIATRKEELFINSLDEVLDKKIGIIKKYAYTDLIQAAYPDLKIIGVESLEDGLEKVRKGELYGYIDALGSIGYAMQKQGNFEIKIAGKIGFDLDLAVGVRNDEPLLYSVFQKAVTAFTKDEVQRIYNKWISVKFEQEMDYSLIYKILGAGLILFLGFAYWNRTLMSEIGRRKEAEMQLETARQKALAASHAKGDFLANMSHEIRTPMNAIIGMSNLALRKNMPEEIREYLKKILYSGQSLLGIINDILDFSKIEAGKIEVETIPFHLPEILQGIFTIFEPTCQEKGIGLHLDIDPGIPEYLLGDPTRIKQIITNFTSNAVKFTGQGSVTITAKVLKEQAGQQSIRLSVTDTGKGIAKENQTKLFEAFTQEDISTTRTHGGTGLGLAISKKLTELMNGTIGLTSKLGEGSCFYIDLKLDIAQEMQLEDGVILASGIGQARILIVDDDKSSRDILKETVGGLTFTVHESSSPDEAKQILENSEKPYDLLLLDWKMPGMSGTEFYKEVGNNPFIQCKPKAILISVYDDAKINDYAKIVGIKTVLRKPVDASELLVAIVNTLGKQAAIKQTASSTLRADKIRFEHQTVLLVEDNELNQEVAQELLKEAGLDVMIASNGQEACDLFSKHTSQISLILMDLQMPVMDGYQASQKIRAQEYGQEIPIIALSADAISGTKEKVLGHGMNDYTTKPIDPQQLILTLSRYLTHHPLDQESRKIQEGLPEIPGINTKKGLSNLMGKEELYKKMLLKFAHSYDHFIPECQDAFQHGDYDALAKKAHMLKGVSGNIQAIRIYELTAKLEEMAKKQEPACHEELKNLEAEITQVHQAIRTALEIDNDPTPPTESEHTDSHPMLPSPDIISRLKPLLELLEEGDTGAQEVLGGIIKQKLPLEIKNSLEKALELVEGYDFDEAAQLVTTILKELE